MLNATFKIRDHVRLELGDTYAQCFSDDELDRFIEDCIVSDVKVTLQLGQYVAGVFKTPTKYHLYGARFTVDPAFLTTGVTEDDFVYDLDEYTLTYKPTSTETRTSVTVQGMSVNFADIMFNVLRALSTDAVKMAMIVGMDGDSVNRDQHYRHLCRMAQQWRGIIGI